MHRSLRLALVVIGLALTLGGCVGLAISILGWGRSAPEDREQVVVVPFPRPPAGATTSSERPVPKGPMTVQRILRDQGQVPWIVLLALGIGLSVVAWPRRRREATS